MTVHYKNGHREVNKMRDEHEPFQRKGLQNSFYEGVLLQILTQPI